MTVSALSGWGGGGRGGERTAGYKEGASLLLSRESFFPEVGFLWGEGTGGKRGKRCRS